MMRDCENGQIRDRLPALVHGTLGAVEGHAVAAHVAQCNDCQAEVTLLHRVRASFDAPHIDTERIVAILPLPGEVMARTAHVRHVRHVRRWRMAAAAAIVVAAVSSLASLRQLFDGGSAAGRSASAMAARRSEGQVMPSIVPDESVQVALLAPALVSASPVTIGAARHLSDAHLRLLLKEMDGLKALPSADPEAPHLALVQTDSSEDRP